VKDLNRRVRLIGLGAVVLFLVLFAQLNYLQVFHADALDHNPRNTRAVVDTFSQPRGAIISADGVTLAESVPSHDQYKYQRIYPEAGLFGQITGYYSLTYSTDGLEDEYNSDLTQSTTSVTFPDNFQDIKNFFTAQPAPDDIQLTVLTSLQKVARQQLAGRDGAVVALQPKTGAVLAMYSNPPLNPTPLASHDPAVEAKAWSALQSAHGSPLLSAAYRQRFFPGSTFKVITSAAVYDHRPQLAHKKYPVSSGFVLPDTAGQVLHNFAGEACGGVMLTLFTVSCDTGYAQLGLGVGAAGMVDEAKAFGWDQVPPLDLPGVAESYFPPVSSFRRDLPALAKSSIGQESVQATPLTMALDVAGIANGGVIMTPHLLEQVTDPQGQTAQTYRPHPWLTATSASTADKMTKLMLSVVNSPNGTGVEARIPGVQVAGKTGTAQTGGPYIETWFVAFAPANNPQIALAVLVENQPSANEYQGGTIAAPIAKAMIESYLEPGTRETS
jgi:penicillin-binding protein A